MSGEQTNHRRCAACKYLRRRCTEDCPLSPYFPPNDPKRFENVHKIFGASNVGRMLRSPKIPPELRGAAADAIAREASCRVEDPVYGITKTICHLKQQCCALQVELAQTQAQISMYKAQIQTRLQTDENQIQNQIQNLNLGGFYGDQQNYDACSNNINSNVGTGNVSDYFKYFPDFC